MSVDLIQKTIDQIKEATKLEKAITTSNNLIGYDLEAPAKNLYPVLAPLRNLIPRSKGKTGSAVRWKAVTGVTPPANPFVAEGARNSEIVYATAEKLATYRTWGQDDSVTREAEWQGRNFDDARARSTKSLLEQTMLVEEDIIIGGNGPAGVGIALGTPTTPTLSAGGSGATLPAATYFVRVVALPYFGYRQSVAPTTLSAFHSAVSGEAGGQAITLGQTLSCTVPVVNGAVAYAWYVGTATGATNQKLEKITTINSAAFSAPLAGTGPNPNGLTDTSRMAEGINGILSQLLESGSGAYIKTMATGTAGAGTGLTYDNAGGIVEIDEALKALWDTARVGPALAVFNSQEAKNVAKKIMTASGQPIFQVHVDPNSGQANLTGGVQVVNYINKFTGQNMKFMVHPTQPAGNIQLLTFGLPAWYMNPEIDGLWDMHMLQDYYEEVYGQVTRKWEHGVYAHGVLRGFMPSAQGLIQNIGDA
jgi:hypothetical protein